MLEVVELDILRSRAPRYAVFGAVAAFHQAQATEQGGRVGHGAVRANAIDKQCACMAYWAVSMRHRGSPYPGTIYLP